MSELRAPISVIIPAHNEERFIEEAIHSVLAQTLSVSEIIVVADDCVDQTKDIALKLGATVLSQNRCNMAAGLNLGITASTQPWIALLDADDFWDKDKIALQWEAIESFPGVGIVSCDVSIISDNGLATTPPRHLRERWASASEIVIKYDDYYSVEKVDGDLLVNVFLATPAVVLSRDVFSTVGQFDEALLFGQTLEFFARVLARYPLAYVQRPLVFQRVHDKNHTLNVESTWSSYVLIVDRMLKNPDLYPRGAGQAYRERLKRDFLETERVLATRAANVRRV